MSQVTRVFRFAVGPTGRKIVFVGFGAIRSQEGRKLISDARRRVPVPAPRTVADFGIWAATSTASTAKSQVDRLDPIWAAVAGRARQPEPKAEAAEPKAEAAEPDGPTTAESEPEPPTTSDASKSKRAPRAPKPA